MKPAQHVIDHNSTLGGAGFAYLNVRGSYQERRVQGIEDEVVDDLADELKDVVIEAVEAADVCSGVGGCRTSCMFHRQRDESRRRARGTSSSVSDRRVCSTLVVHHACIIIQLYLFLPAQPFTRTVPVITCSDHDSNRSWARGRRRCVDRRR